jgi:hypothetical protein
LEEAYGQYRGIQANTEDTDGYDLADAVDYGIATE